jgi:hypothetical protein
MKNLCRDPIPRAFHGAHHREIELLLSACRVRIDAETAGRIRETLHADVDWTWLVQASLGHGVTALLFRSLLQEAGDQIPTDIASAAVAFIDSQRDHNVRRTDELLHLIGAMNESGIAAVPFKGPVLSELVYGDVGLRKFEDLDFLIHKPDIPGCLRVLHNLGYGLDANYDITAYRYHGQDLFLKLDIAVEPHWQLVPSFLGIRLDHDGIWRRVQRTRMRDTEILALSPEDSLRLLCIHGAKHEWSRLLWVCDVAETIRAHSDLDWDRLLSTSRGQGCLRMVLLGLLLGRGLLGSELPARVKVLAERDPSLARLQSQVLKNLFECSSAARGGGRITRFSLSIRDRLRDRTRFLAATVFIPRHLHFRLIPLPPRLFFLAFPIKLLYDYCAIPLWRIAKRIAGSAG